MHPRGLLVYVVRAALVGNRQVFLVFGKQVAGAYADFEGQGLADGKHITVAEPDESSFALVAAASVLEVVPCAAGEEAEVVAVPGIPGVEPPAGLRVYGGYLVVTVLGVFAPSCHIRVGGYGPPAVDEVFDLEGRHEYRVVQ